VDDIEILFEKLDKSKTSVFVCVRKREREMI
jgi:hypothetical protein